MKRTCTLLAASTLLASPFALAQNEHCGTDAVYHRMVKANPGILDEEAGLEAFTRDFTRAVRSGERMNDTTYVIPIVFHVLWSEAHGQLVDGGGENTGLNANISDEQILDQIRILNEDYQKLNPDTIGICCGYEDLIADVNLEFRLATKDPNGNCINGIDRIRTIETYQGDDGAKLNPWYQGKYLNVWVCADMEGGVAGYAYLPATATGPNTLGDGIIIRHNYIGSIGTSSPGTSSALTHEIGHFLNLRHPWGGTNEPTVACGDDEVDDTPITKGHNMCTTADLHDFTCSSADLDTLYTFDLVTTTSGTTDPTPVPTVFDTTSATTGLVMSAFTASNVSANSEADGVFAFSDWDLGATQGDADYDSLDGSINTAKYYQFTVDPALLRGMSLTGITFKVRRSSEGIRTYSVRASTNGYSSNLSAVEAPASNAVEIVSPNIFFLSQDTDVWVTNSRINLTGSPFTQVLDPITFRIYGWNAEADSGTFEVDDVKLLGTFGIIENTQNYMDYSYCSSEMYTDGQKWRMRATLESTTAQRSNLWTADNLAFTGTDGINDMTCAPVADFFATEWSVCQNSNVNFYARCGGTEATSWSWTFQDGNPSTSNAENPVVEFTSGGWKEVSLTATNAYGSHTVTKPYVIWVDQGYPQRYGLLSDGFEDPSNYDHWVHKNYEENLSYFQRVTGIGHTGNACVLMNGFNTFGPNDLLIDDGGGDIDELNSPSLDLTYASGLELTFWYAYATQANNADDLTENLSVWYSLNCGATWTQKTVIDQGDLVTNGSTGAYYVPGSSLEWRQAVIPFSQLNNKNKVKIRFDYVSSAFSNNLYIDDIQLNGTVGLAEVETGGAGLAIYPNPTDGGFNIDHALAKASAATIEIHDAVGRLVFARSLGVTTSGTLHIEADDLHLNPGTYSVSLRSEAGSAVQRLVIR